MMVQYLLIIKNSRCLKFVNQIFNKTIYKDRLNILSNTEGWTWSEKANTFEENLDIWEKFINKHGKHPKASSKNINEKIISNWVSKIRNYYKNKSHLLKKEQIELLNKNQYWIWKVRDGI